MTTEQRKKALADMPAEVYLDTIEVADWFENNFDAIKEALSAPNPCCGAVGKEACMRYDQIAEDCDCNKIKGDAVTREDTGRSRAFTTSPTTIKDTELIKAIQEWRDWLLPASYRTGVVDSAELNLVEKFDKYLINHAMKGERE